MKEISNEQIQTIMNALQKANVGIQDYVAIQQMLLQLPSKPVATPPPQA
jgi:hypothetical protein